MKTKAQKKYILEFKKEFGNTETEKKNRKLSSAKLDKEKKLKVLKKQKNCFSIP